MFLTLADRIIGVGFVLSKRKSSTENKNKDENKARSEEKQSIAVFRTHYLSQNVRRYLTATSSLATGGFEDHPTWSSALATIISTWPRTRFDSLHSGFERSFDHHGWGALSHDQMG